MTLGKKFFNRNSVIVAKELLGKFLVRKIGKKIIALPITETEAYGGPVRDLASHASRGRTPRNFPMFGPPGRFYVYFTYGMHWMLNVVTKFDKHPSAVLIRGAGGINGPARLTKFLKVNRKFNDRPVSRQTGLWIASSPKSYILHPKSSVRSAYRIGVAYAGPVWSKKKWRFYIEK